VIRPTACVAALLLAGVYLPGCAVERRPDLDEGPDTTAFVPEEWRATEALRDSARAVIDALHTALEVGDGARVAALAAPGATIVDQEEGVFWKVSGPDAGPLPAPLSEKVTGLGWRRVRSDVQPLADAILVVDRYEATVSGEPVRWSATESFVVVRAIEGWRILLAHRSRGEAGAS